jgi:antibiotic biosynthesis monooxygenase (ABM) superfamily enzyme
VTLARARAPARNRWKIEHDYDYEHQHEEANMIARIWHGWTKPEDAKAYEKMLRDEIFPGIAARKIEGYRGAELFIREDGNEVEFVTLLRFDSMDAVADFAGADASKPVIYPKAEALIIRMESARHYRIAI